MTPIEFTTEIPDGSASFDEIIDVRSPSEFLEDHIPGAINLPVLDDEQRALVGTIYKQSSPFEARKLGAALISENIAGHIRRHFIERDKSYRAFLYCWRGGQRSHSMATILAAIGWRVTLLEGGYRTYRREVLRGIQSISQSIRMVLVGGLTGTGKTEILHHLRDLGHQVLDLENLASHRGSALGALPGTAQPSQKYFESLLFQKLTQFDPGRVVFSESESHRIGSIRLPPDFWNSFKKSPVIEVTAPLEVRARFLVDGYPEYISQPEQLLLDLSSARRFANTPAWHALIQCLENSRWVEAARLMLEHHYDPAYRGSIHKWFGEPLRVFTLPALRSDDLLNCAVEIAEYTGSHSNPTDRGTGSAVTAR